MSKLTKKGLYSSPEMETMELMAQQVICESTLTNNGLGDWTFNDNDL